ncbi:MAK10-like protein [Tanacetum coccineum]
MFESIEGVLSQANIRVRDHNLRMLSFSTGRRGCPGVLLGSTMSVMLLARLVQGFTWELPPNEPYVDLKENLHDLAKAKPLLALAKPRVGYRQKDKKRSQIGQNRARNRKERTLPEFIGEGYIMSTICVEYEWASPGCSSFGHVLDECPKKIDSDVLSNLKKPTQAIRGIPVGSKLKSTFIYRPVHSTKMTDKAPAKPKVTNSTTSISNSCDALNTLVDEDDYGGMNSASTQEPEQVEGSGKKDINTSVPTRLCYKTPISVVSSVHKSSLVASDSHNSTPLAERINKLGKQMLDGKLILVDDDVKPLNKVDSDPVDSDSEHEVEVAYDERLNSWLVEVQMMQDYMRTKTMTSMITFLSITSASWLSSPSTSSTSPSTRPSTSCIWKAFGGNTRDLGSFGEETDKTTNLHQHLSRISTQKLETASQITRDAVTTHLKTASQDLQTASDCDENPIRTLGDYSKPSHKGYRNTIELPVGNNVVPLRSDTIRLVQNGCLFHGLWSEDPNQHLKDFLKLVDSLNLDDENKERTRIRTIDQSAGSKLRDHNAEESWALLEDLALYDNESWNDPRDFDKPLKAMALPPDVSSTSDRRLIKLEN